MELIAVKKNQSVYLQALTSGLTEIHKLSSYLIIDFAKSDEILGMEMLAGNSLDRMW